MSSVVTILASRAGLRYVTPVTRVPSFTRRVRAASPPSSVYPSSMGCVGPPSGGSCQKWSMTQTESKPACSPATARSATFSNISRSGTPANVKFGIWRPNLVICSVLSRDRAVAEGSGARGGSDGGVGRGLGGELGALGQLGHLRDAAGMVGGVGGDRAGVGCPVVVAGPDQLL